MLWLSVTFLALFASVQGRAVNISNTWVLPEEGFPVFYRYFRDRISWYEADAVCQFHHANLVTVDTTAQYDAVRAYLKELDISSAIWVGLIRSNPDGDFTWTDYRGLSSEGYWSSAPDARAAPLCAAADPSADYRWEARACGGPTVASFICELPVPQWALGNDGCMVRALPALTVLYLPESAAVQLTADCGLAGVKRVQCTGNVKREELLKDLSCSDEDDSSSTLSLTSTSTVWPVTDTTFTDLTTDDLSTENNIATEYQEIINTGTQITETHSPNNLNLLSEVNTPIKQNINTKDYIQIPLHKDLEQNHKNNIVSNDIPLQDNSITDLSLQNIENSKNYKHRLLHDEMTRLGNLETIFTQPADHFVPPLVMAKAKISDDMTVLSLQEKHAQQLAEHRQHKHNMIVEHTDITPSQTTASDLKSTTSVTLTPTKIVKQDKALVQNDNNIKKNVKSSAPKKYIDKYNNPKAKIWRTVDNKIPNPENLDILSTMQTLSRSLKVEIPTSKPQIDIQGDSEEDSIIDLTVIIKEPGVDNGQEIFYSNHSNSITKMEPLKNMTKGGEKEVDIKYSTTDKPIYTNHPVTLDKKQASSTVILNQEKIKITEFEDQTSTVNLTPIVFEVSTMLPVLNNNSVEIKDTLSSTITSEYPSSSSSIGKDLTTIPFVSSSTTETQPSSSITVLTQDKHITSVLLPTDNITVKNEENIVFPSKEPVTKQSKTTTDAATVASAMTVKITKDLYKNETFTVNLPTNLTEITITESENIFNHTEHIEEEQDMIDDYQSPLLSAANEPLHRPNRSRRPQPPPNRMNKFNPFRMLG